MTDDDDDRVGYREPPKSSRFKKGQSGNRKGRPPNDRSDEEEYLIYDEVLGVKMKIKVDGVEQEVTTEQAFLLYMFEEGLKGAGSAARDLYDAIDKARRSRGESVHDSIVDKIEVRFHGVLPWLEAPPLTGPIEDLKMATIAKIDDQTEQAMLEPWIVQKALGRFTDRRLSVGEQADVVAATRNPHKVNWPDWWEVRPDL